MTDFMHNDTLLNFHTHQIRSDPTTQTVYNARFSDWMTLPASQLFSLGIHPWDIHTETFDQELEQLEKAKPRLTAIGECGLDRLINIPLELQKVIFKQQLQLAERWQKPVIIHCVRAFPELISLVKSLHIQVPLIVHGYNANQEIFRQLLQHGFYFSLGYALLKEDSHAAKCLLKLPLERLFLETDDRDLSIQTIFARASERLYMPVNELSNQIWGNFRQVTGLCSTGVPIY
ncbi:MAG: TatD family hydrolase [Siphonobacter sp.]